MTAACAAGCVDEDTERELGEASQELASPEGQGWDHQGWDHQGWDHQGWDHQGWDHRGTTQGSVTFSGTSVVGTALETWRSIYILGTGWRAEQRLPNKRCTWSTDKTILYSCTAVNLATTPSPLAGMRLNGTFTRDDGSTYQAYIRIGASTSTIGAVVADTKNAMHPLTGHSSSASCTLVANGYDGCMHPGGCRRNCDIWLYDLDLVTPDGDIIDWCPSGNRATAIAGSYGADGSYNPGSGEITLACVNGTIAKCTRWGYRPWGYSQKRCTGSGCSTGTGLYSMLNCHRSCVRAAMADYCANGISFTKNGTLVDVYDYEESDGVGGFVPRTESLPGVGQTTAFLWESRFDRYGATQLDHLRYQELNPSLASACPGRFYESSDDALQTWNRESPTWGNPSVRIDSTTACAHSELTVGKWLHGHCNSCTNDMSAYCTNPADPRGWDANCVAEAASRCTATDPPMTAHSECTTGAALPKFATGCTLRVCNERPSCCNSTGGTWDSTCASTAASKCTGGQEHWNRFSNFCNGVVINPPPEPPPIENRL